MNINEFIQKHRTVRDRMTFEIDSLTPHVMCQDGFTMSVQAGKGFLRSLRRIHKFWGIPS